MSDLLFDQQISGATVAVASASDNIAPQIGLVGNGGATNDTTPTILGTIIGELNDDESVQVLRDGDIVGEATLDGAIWSFQDNLNPLGEIEGEYLYTAQVFDVAGNAGNGGQFSAQSEGLTLQVDTTAPAQRVVITQILSDQFGEPVIVPRGQATSDTTPTIVVTIGSLLDTGDNLQLLRTQGGSVQVIGQIDAQTAAGQQSFQFDDLVVAGSAVTYQAQVVDAAGLAGLPSSVYVVSISDPLNNLP